jgi:hypothetical protein
MELKSGLFPRNIRRLWGGFFLCGGAPMNLAKTSPCALSSFRSNGTLVYGYSAMN